MAALPEEEEDRERFGKGKRLRSDQALGKSPKNPEPTRPADGCSPEAGGNGPSSSLMAGGNPYARQAWAQGQGQWKVSDLDCKLCLMRLGAGGEGSDTGEGPRGSGSEG